MIKIVLSFFFLASSLFAYGKDYTDNALSHIEGFQSLLFKISENGSLSFIIPWWLGFIILFISIFILGSKLIGEEWDEERLVDGNTTTNGISTSIFFSMILFWIIASFVGDMRKELREKLDSYPDKHLIFIEDKLEKEKEDKLLEDINKEQGINVSKEELNLIKDLKKKEEQLKKLEKYQKQLDIFKNNEKLLNNNGYIDVLSYDFNFEKVKLIVNYKNVGKEPITSLWLSFYILNENKEYIEKILQKNWDIEDFNSGTTKTFKYNMKKWQYGNLARKLSKLKNVKLLVEVRNIEVEDKFGKVTHSLSKIRKDEKDILEKYSRVRELQEKIHELKLKIKESRNP